MPPQPGRLRFTAGIVLSVIIACARHDAQANTALADSAARERQDSVSRAQPGYVIDSMFPIAEEIRRFNAHEPRIASLTSAARSRGELVRLFAAALAQRDTAALVSLLVTRAEFGQLLFPESPYTRAPYKTKPGVLWLQLANESERGLARLLHRAAGDSVHVGQLQCEHEPERQGANRIWRECSVEMHIAEGSVTRIRLFGPVLERAGRAKFLSYATDY